MICPYLKLECPLAPQCGILQEDGTHKLTDSTGKVDCIEWVKKERRIGFKLAGETPPKELDPEKGI